MKIWISILLVCSTLFPCSSLEPKDTKVTLKAKNVLLRSSLEQLAESAGLRLVTPGRWPSEPRVSYDFRDQPLGLAMEELTYGKKLHWHIFSKSLIVGDQKSLKAYLASITSKEVIVRKVEPSKLMSFLAKQYWECEFIPHPTLPGFYVKGPKEAVDSVLKDVPNLDRPAP